MSSLAVWKFQIRKVISVVQGIVATTRRSWRFFNRTASKPLPCVPALQNRQEVFARPVGKACRLPGVDYARAEEMKHCLDSVCAKIHEIDKLTWMEQPGNGRGKPHLDGICKRFDGGLHGFRRTRLTILKIAQGRTPISHDLRIGVIGIPAICEDLYSFLTSLGGTRVFNEIQRQFSMPYQTKTLVEQYSHIRIPTTFFPVWKTFRWRQGRGT